ncbi:MAG: hypothetical protein QOE65_71 [Solirubrobacteraceae bacterium]|jgi:hypothetical protein|nr:hypothetical protein [Solirubrobacteraceae bacterium]
MIPRARGALPYVLAFLVAFGVYYDAYEQIDPHPFGDEPHYVLEALSLAHDGDRDLSNDYYDPAEVTGVLGFAGLDLHAYRYTSSHRLVSVHHVGLPALLAPAARTNDIEWIRKELILVAALGAMALLGVLRSLRILRGPLCYLVWGAAAFSLPVVQFSSQIYPELPAATLLLISLWIALARPLTPRRAAVAGAVAALVPWLHVRYTVLAVPLVVGIAATAAHRARRDADGPPRAAALRAAGAAVAPAVVSLLAMSVAFWAWYGSPALDAQYRLPATKAFVHHEGWFVYQYAAGNLLGAQFGWLPIAPAHLLGIAALGLLVWRYRWTGALAALVFAGYVLVVSTGQPGYAFAARFMVPVVPLVAVPLALAVAYSRAARLAFLPLAGLTWAFTVQGMHHADRLYANVGDILRLPLSVKLHTLWPFVPAPPPGIERYPAAVFVAGWVFGLALVGWLLVEVAAGRRRATV